jgi:hypothetical protein
MCGLGWKVGRPRTTPLWASAPVMSTRELCRHPEGPRRPARGTTVQRVQIAVAGWLSPPYSSSVGRGKPGRWAQVPQAKRDDRPGHAGPSAIWMAPPGSQQYRVCLWMNMGGNARRRTRIERWRGLWEPEDRRRPGPGREHSDRRAPPRRSHSTDPARSGGRTLGRGAMAGVALETEPVVLARLGRPRRRLVSPRAGAYPEGRPE